MELNQLCNQLWNICNEFKNKTNMNSNYLEYISALLYLRYYDSDIFTKIYEQRENFYLNIIIDKEIENLRRESEDRNLFSDIQFKNISFYRSLGEKNVLNITIEQLYTICKKSSKEYIANAYEFIIKKSAIKDIKGTEEIFYTPQEIANVITEILIEKEKAEVYDPICSSGNFLIKAMEKGNAKIYGEEKNIEYYNILKTRILLNDIDGEEIKYQENTNIKNMKFDYIISNPPFSQRNWKYSIEDKRIFNEYGLSENAVGDYAYVLTMLEKLKENGRMAVVLPHGVLFRENEKRVRQRLVEKNEIEAIIGLPENLFYNTRIPVIILVISKKRKKDTVMFIDASNEFKTEKNSNRLTQENQSKIIETYQKNKEIKGYSKIVNINEIKDNEFNLSIKKYIIKEEKKEYIEDTQLIKKLKNLEDEKDILEQNIKDILSVLNVKYFQEEKNKEKNNKEKYEIDDKKIGENIKKARIAKGYTQFELADKLEVMPTYIYRIERGMNGIRLQLLAEICNVLEISIEEIMR